jgi:hypothetical protein
MSNELDPIVAGIGFNDGANKGFWRHQPRDHKKRWMEMGAEARALFKKLRADGTVEEFSAIGKVVGSTGSADQARILIKGNPNLKDGVYAVNSDSLESIKAQLSAEYLKSQGIDPNADKFGNDVGGLVPQDLATTETADITPGDLNLADGGTATPEGKEMSQYKDSAEGKARDAADANGSPAPATPAAPGDSHDQAIANAWNDAMNGGTPTVDIVINAAQGPSDGGAKTKKLIDLNPGDQIVDKNGNIVTYVTSKDAGNGRSEITFTKADGTTAKTIAASNTNFNVAPKKAAPAPASTPAAKSVTKVQVDQIDNFADQVANDPNIDPAVKQSFDDLVSRLDNGEDVSSDDAKAVLDQVKAHFGKSTSPKKTPTVVAPKKAAPTIPPVEKKSAAEIAKAKGRIDDGGDVALNTNGLDDNALRDLELNTPLLDENGKPVRDPNNPKKIIQDPNAIVNAILEKFPDAKVQGDNNKIILERSEWTDPVTGKKYAFEMGLSRTYGNQFVQHYKFTDAATGEVKDFQLADYKDSFAGIFAKRNGLLTMRGHLLGETRPGTKITREISTYFGPNKDLNQRLKYFRKGSDKFGWAFLTPEENISKFLEGTDRKLNMSMVQTGIGPDGEPRYQFGNVLRGQVSPFWDALESKNYEDMKWRITQLLGRMPDSPDSRKLLTDTLRKGIVSRFAGQSNAKGFHTYANLLDMYMKSNKVDLRDVNRTPYVYGDGNTVAKLGDKVVYFPNEKDHSVGQIIAFNAGSGKNGQYHDTVRVQFADGTSVDLLQTRNMFPAGPTSEFGNPDLTNYTANAKLDEKLALRKALLGPALDVFNQKRSGETPAEQKPSDTTPIDPNAANPNASQPYLGSNGKPANSSGTQTSDSSTATPVVNTGTPAADATPAVDNTPAADATPAAPVDGNVTQLQPNDSFYGSNGDYLGVVVETQEVPAADGGAPGLAVFYIDENGNEQVEVVEKSENRSPK